MSDAEYIASPTEWVRNQVELYESSNGTEGYELRDSGLPVILVTNNGRETGAIRKTPLMRVKVDEGYVLVASMGGQPKHPVWYYNLVADPNVTIRERLDLLVDKGTFQEIGQLAGAATYDGEKLVDVRPSNRVVGLCELDGRKVVLNGGDFTVRGGAADAAIGNKGGYAQNMAGDWRLPYLRLLDSTGGSVKTFEQ